MKPLDTADRAARPEMLPPCAETLVVLVELRAGRPTAALRTFLLRDPGTLLTYLSTHRPQTDSNGSLFPSGEDAAEAAERLLQELERRSGGSFADWTTPEARAAYQFSQAARRVARFLAERAGISLEHAEIAALFGNLGQLVQAQASPAAPKVDSPGLSETRALVRRGSLPDWLAKVLLCVDLPAELATKLDAGTQLLLVVQAAIGLVQCQLAEKPLLTVHLLENALVRLHLPSLDRDEVAKLIQAEEGPPGNLASEGALLWRLLHLVPQGRQLADPGYVDGLEREAEKLREYLEQQRLTEADRLNHLKLRAVAELAAGAGHEINNPLAVISGQAQYLLRTEENLGRVRALERIIAQSKRIHELLKDLMLYARPPQLKRKQVNLPKLVRKAIEALEDFALERGVNLNGEESARRISLHADPALLEVAVSSLIRNAIEAAPAGGWARVAIEVPRSGPVEIIVEDNGPGLTAAQREHLFDPFYCGRSAGRGSGLGLSKSWRIAQLHGGEIRFEPLTPQGTRFVLALPATSHQTGRKRSTGTLSRNGLRNGRHRRRRR